MLLLNSYGVARINDIIPISDIQVLQLGAGGYKFFHALLGDIIVTPKERDAPAHGSSETAFQGRCHRCQLGTCCDEFLDVMAAETITLRISAQCQYE